MCDLGSSPGFTSQMYFSLTKIAFAPKLCSVIAFFLQCSLREIP
jgi:hypothetical protein